jgi:hypothetical protein
MIDWILSKLEHYSSKINVWCWQKRWGHRDKGTGYKKGKNNE